MAKLIFFCGKMAAGKSTLAKELAARELAVVLSQDDLVERLFPGEFAILPTDGAAYTASGLSYPTKFNLARRVELPFNGRWFAVPPGARFGQQPKLGVLHPALMRRAQAAFSAAAPMARTPD